MGKDASERNSIAEANWKAYQRGIDAGHDKYLKRAKKCDDYYVGEQWEQSDKDKLDAEGRPALTINAVKPAVNTILGEYSSQRADFIFKPRGGAVEETAVVLSKLVQQIQDNNKYEDVEGDVFADGIIEDRGYFDIRLDFSDSIMGEVRITSEDPADIILDSHAKNYDPKTWSEVIKTRWLTLDEIGLFYGKKKADEVQAVAGTEPGFGQDSIRYHQQTFGDIEQYMANGDEDTRTVRRVRVIERQYYKTRRVKMFVDPNTGDERQVQDSWDDARIDAFAQQMGLMVYAKTARNVRWTITADGVVLHDDWSPYRTFTIIPFFPFWRRGRPTGMVADLLSPQEQLNKVESQQLHIVNTTANSGWTVEQGSLVNMNEDELEERGAETGLVLVYARGRAAPEKIKPNSVPTGLDRIGQKALENLREIGGVKAMLGNESAAVSGVALEKKQSRSLVQMQVPFDNLRRTRNMVAGKILELVQDFYTETRVFRATNYNSLQRETEEVVVNGMTPEGRVINDLTIGEYDVVVATAPARDTWADSQFAEALNMRNVGVQIPDHWVINYSNLSEKRAVAEEVRNMQGLGEPSPEQQEMAQFQMQIQIAAAQLEVQELQAKVQELQTRALLNQAKAETLTGQLQLDAQAQQISMQSDLQRMQADLMKKSADLQNKLQLASMHIEANRQETMYTTTSKRASEELRGREGIAKEVMKASLSQTKAVPAG